ncbi:Na+/H+ antiporter subunit C [Paracoccus nototheniae]|uniref:Na+/H+ antiporter subunit C n=1 Tax=Paracoccus nototheniae TaxID=2489002 RepID=A0ABW4DWV0_9RHOB|nr:Na+/H+ antiporter subunit C [Paracoccus nototheniae]
MELLLAITLGILVSTSVYLMLDRNVLRFLFGLVLLSNAVNLLIFAGGRLTAGAPPLIDAGASSPTGVVANALPQALVLTAIVIGFGLLAFTLALVYRTFMTLGTVNSDEMRVAEPMGAKDLDRGKLGLGRADPQKPASGQEAGI